MAWPAAVGLAGLLLYLTLAPRVPGDGDSGEFMLVLATGGVSHPTGYPICTLLGFVFTRLLHGLGTSWAYAANAWSALGAGLAIFLFTLLGLRLAAAERGLRARHPLVVSVAGAALLGLNPVWLVSATQAEVYSWHLAWIAGACLMCLGLIRRMAAPESSGRKAPLWWAAGWGAVCGVGLAHHLTAAFFILPLTVVLLAEASRRRLFGWKMLAGGLAGALIPLLSYTFIVYRAFHPARAQWPLLEPGLASILTHIRGSEYTVFLGHFQPADEQRRALAAYIYPLLIPGFMGMVAMAVRRRDLEHRGVIVALLVAAAVQCLFVLNYGVPDPGAYFLPAVMISMLLVPVGGSWLGRRLPPAVMAVLVGAAIVAAAVAWVPKGVAASRKCVEVDRIVHARWRSIPFDTGIVLWRNDFYCHLRAYQILGGERPGLYVENPNMLTWAAPRRAFERRFGFDPVGGMALNDAEDVLRIPANIARQTRLPVLDFQTFQPW